MFWHNEEYSMGLGKDIYLDGVVCLMDAVYGQRVGTLPVSSQSRKLTSLCVLQQIEEDYASEGEGESIRFGTTFAGILIPISLGPITDKWHARM